MHDSEHTVTCGNCANSWCERCDPAPSAMCHWCHGRGYSMARANQFGSCGYHSLMSDYRMFTSGDSWGDTMAAFFATAAEMYWRGLDIPSAWQYSPGAGSDPRDAEDIWFESMESADDDALEQFGAVMARYSDGLRRADMAY